MTIQRRASYSSHPDGCQNVAESGVAKHTPEETQDSGIVYYASGSKGNQFPTKTLMFLGGPVLYHPLHDWLHGSNLFVVYD